MADTLPVEGEWVPIKQGDVVAAANNVSATGAGGVNAQAQLEQLKLDVSANRRLIEDNAGPAPDITSLRSKVDALFPLTPDVGILTDWADIYDPVQAVGAVVPVTGYSSFIDYRAVGDRFESAGISFAAGTDVIDYTGIGTDLHRCFGFRVSGASNLTLLSIVDGAEVIPFLDITAAGNLRVNNFTPSRTQDEQVTNRVNLVTSPTSGTGTLTAGGPVSTYTAPPYPANTSNQSRSVSVSFEVLVNGSDSLAGGGIGFDIPDDLTAQARQTIQHTFNLGFPHNRMVTVTIGYEVRVSGSDLLIDLDLQTAPSDITLTVENLDVVQSYTATVIIARVDDYITFTDELGTFTFSGDHEFLFAFHPVPGTDQMNVVPVAINTTSGATSQLNDALIAEPTPGFAAIRIPDTIEFRSFLPDHFLRHIDLVNLLADRTTKWVYALARLEATNTVHAITEPVNLAAGTTLDGEAISSGTKKVVVHQATGTGTGAGELIQNVVLPADYADFDYVHCTIRAGGVPLEWRTAFIDTALLASSDFASTDIHRVQGDEDFTWTVGSRTLTLQSSEKVWRAVLLRF